MNFTAILWTPATCGTLISYTSNTPSFVSFNNSALDFSIKSNDYKMIGFYTITVTATLNNYYLNSTTFIWTLNVTGIIPTPPAPPENSKYLINNTAPYFVSSLSV